METVVGEGAGGLASRWWALLVRGLVAVLFGVFAFMMPGASLLGLIFVWGAYALVSGILELVVATQRGRGNLRWGWYVFEGLVSIAAGIVAFAWPGITALALAMVIAVWAILTGVAAIGAAIELRKVLSGEWLLAATGVMSIAFGVLVVAFPVAGVVSIVWLIGAYAVIFGALMIGLAFRLKHWRDGAVPQGTPRFA